MVSVFVVVVVVVIFPFDLRSGTTSVTAPHPLSELCFVFSFQALRFASFLFISYTHTTLSKSHIHACKKHNNEHRTASRRSHLPAMGKVRLLPSAQEVFCMRAAVSCTVVRRSKKRRTSSNGGRSNRFLGLEGVRERVGAGGVDGIWLVCIDGRCCCQRN